MNTIIKTKNNEAPYITGAWHSYFRSQKQPEVQQPPTNKEGAKLKPFLVFGIVIFLVVLAALVTVVYLLLADKDAESGSSPALDEEFSPSSGYELEIYNNPMDYRAFQAVTENGTVTLYGDKDASGILVQPEMVEYMEEDGTKTTVVLDSTGFIQSITSDGVSIQLAWSPGDDSVTAVALKMDGSIQANVITEVQNRSYSSSSPMYEPVKSDQSHIIRKHHEPSLSYTRVPVSVNTCGEPVVNATVYASAIFDYDQTQPSQPIQVKGYYTGEPGQYEVLLPAHHVSDDFEETESLCMGISDVLSEKCKTMRVLDAQSELRICTNLASAVEAMSLALPDDVTSVYTTCQRGFQAAGVTCSAFESSDSDQAPFDSTCVSVKTPVNIATTVRQDCLIQPFARISSGLVLSAEAKVIHMPTSSSSTSETSFVLEDDGSMFKLVYLEAYPRNPEPMEEYNVRMYHGCLGSGAIIMQVEGSDEYRDSKTCLASDKYPFCQLYVPGAIAKVKDTVTITYNTDEGQTLFARQVVQMF